jgi:hypothetical protein
MVWDCTVGFFKKMAKKKLQSRWDCTVGSYGGLNCGAVRWGGTVGRYGGTVRKKIFVNVVLRFDKITMHDHLAQFIPGLNMENDSKGKSYYEYVTFAFCEDKFDSLRVYSLIQYLYNSKLLPKNVRINWLADGCQEELKCNTFLKLAAMKNFMKLGPCDNCETLPVNNDVTENDNFCDSSSEEEDFDDESECATSSSDEDDDTDENNLEIEPFVGVEPTQNLSDCDDIVNYSTDEDLDTENNEIISVSRNTCENCFFIPTKTYQMFIIVWAWAPGGGG